FLRSLPTHYAELAQRDPGKTAPAVNDFVTAQMLRLRENFTDGTNLEAAVFFTANRKNTSGPVCFDGCATCHEVTGERASAPSVTPPAMPDRWIMGAHFDHAKHASVDCLKCHAATKS